MHGDRVAVDRGFRRDPQLSPVRQDQQAALGARMLDRGAHDRDEQLLLHDCAGDRLRQLDDGREVELFDGRPDRARRTARSFILPEERIHLVELPHLAVGSPTQVAVAGVSKVEMRDLIEATRRVEPRGELVSERLIVNKAVDAGRADGLLVQAFGIEFAAFQSGHLGADQRGAVLEIFRAILCPDFELSVMGSQGRHVPPALV